MGKIKDRAICLFILLVIAIVPVHLLVNYGIIEDTIKARVIGAGVGIFIYMMVR